MPPKGKDPKAMKPSVQKTVQDKVPPMIPLMWKKTQTDINRRILDFRSQKRSSTPLYPPPHQHARIPNQSNNYHRKKVARHKNKSPSYNRKLAPLVLRRRSEKPPKKPHVRPRRKPPSKRRRRLQTYSSLYKCRKYHSASTQRVLFVCITRMVTVRRVCGSFSWGKRGGLMKGAGKKCKFSHDLSVERKTLKKNLYEDGRDEEIEENKKDESMDNWDEEKLRSVVMSKHGNPKTTTDKVCKFFIDAVENGKYGWFWQCAFPTASFYIRRYCSDI